MKSNQIKYLVALSVLRHVYSEGLVDVAILERINHKNAEETGCRVIKI